MTEYEIVEALSNVDVFICKYCKIEVTGKGLFPFNLYQYQRAALTTYLKNKGVCILKSRQMGFTTLAAAFGLWKTYLPGNNILFLSKKEDDAMDIVRKVRIMYDNLPKELRAKVVSVNQTTIEFANKNRIQSLPATERSGAGKCHAKGTGIIMYDGSIKKVENIVLGDLVMGVDSTSRRVMKLARGVEKMYEIKPMRGESFTVNESHILSLKFKRKGHTNHNKIINISVKDYLKGEFTQKKYYKLWRTGIDFKEKKIIIDPYFLGLWLGDGRTCDKRICSMDKEIIEYLVEYGIRLGGGCKKGNDKKRGKAGMYSVYGDVSLTTLLREEGVLNNKHIPHKYKCNLEENRLQLLAGLLDSDGYVDKTGYVFCNINETLIDDVLFLARSLGFFCTKTSYIAKLKSRNYEVQAYKVFINGDCDRIPLKIERKRVEKRKINKDWLISGFDVIEKKVDSYYGFSVNKDSLYLLDSFIVTHNSASVIVLDEFSAFPSAKGEIAGQDVWTSILPTISTGGQVIVQSTPKGVGNKFYQIWAGDSKMVKERYDWTMHPIYRVGLRERPVDKYGKWTSDWAEDIMPEMTPDGWAQEYNCDFVQSGRPVFDWDTLYKTDILEEDLTGHFACGVDLSSGSSSDFHVATFVNVETGRQVETMRSQDALDIFAQKVKLKCKKYNNAYLAFENNSGYGLSFMKNINDYTNLYYQTVYDKKREKRTRKLGWNTNVKTKSLMITDLNLAIINKEVKLVDEQTIEELKSFQYDDNDKMQAMAGCHDDCVMALAIAWQAAKALVKEENYIPQKRTSRLGQQAPMANPGGGIPIPEEIFWKGSFNRDWRLA